MKIELRFLLCIVAGIAAVSAACTDTPNWNNGQRSTCRHYRAWYCRNNSAGAHARAFYNHPEKNCCGFGKECTNDIECTLLSDTCTDGTCLCGDSPACASGQVCESGICVGT